MQFSFTKMHGAGNDFVVIDGCRQQINLSHEQLRVIADRHFGIGCDQILLVEPPSQPENDFRYRIFNADGGEVEQCGNGARCFARFVVEQGLTTRSEIKVETLSGIITPRLESDGRVTVNMGMPEFTPGKIPFSGPQATSVSLNTSQGDIELTALSMGNPHAVMIVQEELEQAPVASLGAELEHHPAFPNRVNVGFMQIENRHTIRLRVFERGAGETLACGTGACAAVVAGICRQQLDTRVDVQTRGGLLTIQWAGNQQPVLLTGPAVTVFQGNITL